MNRSVKRKYTRGNLYNLLIGKIGNHPNSKQGDEGVWRFDWTLIRVAKILKLSRVLRKNKALDPQGSRKGGGGTKTRIG